MAKPSIEPGEYFKSLLGQRPKRARVGHGSFLTFDFGHASKKDHKLRYDWHLWIQNSDWRLVETTRGIAIAESESKRGPMQAAVEGLEKRTLDKVVHELPETVFVFSGSVELICKPYSDAAEDEDCWALYTPDGHVLLADRLGRLRYVRSHVPEPSRSSSRQRNDMARA